MDWISQLVVLIALVFIKPSFIDVCSKSGGSEFDSCHIRVVNLDRAKLTNVTFQDCDLVRTNMSLNVIFGHQSISKYIQNRELPAIYLCEAKVKSVEFENTQFSQKLLAQLTKEPIWTIKVKEKLFSGLYITKDRN
ncbi:pentapeptide repeat-containing protein [Fictibacillus sp. NRS-1165]|uniref:pentapeptide repeat-containing protein n=1 Tax=Fictibacillus sp. NRS-1165 TaxID=3144463 RepID=UPI003D1A1813